MEAEAASNSVAKVLPNADVVDLAAYKAVKPQVRPQIRLAPPARFELALPPPESQKTTIWRRWKSTKLQVRPTFSGWSLLAELGRFRFWCCQSVANAPPRDLANRVFLAERFL